MEKQKPVILHIETATNVCSTALSKGEEILALRESLEDKSHGRLLTLFIDEVLKESGLSAEKIDAVTVSKGPGSYTGLRIGVSVTKGFAYGLGIPVIGINTLKALTVGARLNKEIAATLKSSPDALLCPMLDARRMEVYYALFKQDLREVEPVAAKIIDEKSFISQLEKHPVIFFGNGSAKTREIIRHPNAYHIDNIACTAPNLIPLALSELENKNFEDTAYFEPFYLKDFIATTPKKKVL